MSVPPQKMAEMLRRHVPFKTTESGMIEAGNINLSGRPQVKNPDGTISTVRSIGVNIDGQEILIPTVVNGKVVSDKAAIEHYRKTGQHLGKFGDVESATKYAQKLHEQEAQRIK